MCFEKVTPESVGIASERVLSFVKMLDESHMRIHSVLMAKGDKLFAESYYAPFHRTFLHRMYSVSKSFVSIAVGMAVTEGIMKINDVIVDYFPEFRTENTDAYFEECTVEDMLRMQSNVNIPVAWWGKYGSRVEAYYAQKTGKIPGTLYFYDSVGSFLLGCIIEKITGKTFLVYLKEKVLLEIGFSEESYTLYEPGGFTVGDSGVMCTAEDLMLFARFIMNRGAWNGKQYIDPEFMERAVSVQTDNNLYGAHKTWNNSGYGYLIWMTHEDGFSLVGMGDQLAVCDRKSDVIVVITADNQGDETARPVIFHELIHHFFPKVKKEPLAENKASYEAMETYLNSRKLTHQWGKKETAFSKLVSGRRYLAELNDHGITAFTLDLSGQEGVFTLEKEGKTHKIPFGIGENKPIRFSFGEVPKPDAMGFMIEGTYACMSSGAWTAENIFCIKLQVTDTYFGCLHIHMGFKDNRATLALRKSGQYVFDGMECTIIGKGE